VVTEVSKAPDSRQRFIDVAVRLFTQHSFAGTSLQMIADEVGVTKAAVYHHFRTREDLLNAVLEPLLEQIRTTVEAAEAQRSVSARAEYMLSGYVDLAVRNRDLMSVLAADSGAIDMLRSQHELGELIDRQVKLLADVSAGPEGIISAAVVLAGIVGAAGKLLVVIDEEDLKQHLVQTGRRALGLRAPRAPKTA
jgi:AcrR family transcriptional regulator